MNIKDTLIKDFVNAINTKPEKKTAMYYGEIVEVSDDSGVKKAYVHLDGSESDIKTPIVEGTEVLEGDRVLVTIENHQAVVLANITSPASARTAKNYMDLSEEDEGLVIGALNDENNNYNVLIKADGVYIRDGQDVMAIYGGDGTYIYADGEPAAEFTAEGIQFFTDLANYAKFDPVTGEFTSQSLDYLHLDNLEANFAHITNGVIDNATIDHADINDLEANYAHITNGVIDNATIGYADVDDLEANYAHITEGVIDNAKIGYADVENLESNYAHITNGTIDNAKIGYADVNDLNAHYASITNGVITNATIDQAKVNNLQSNYAHITNGFIDNADIKEADVENLTTKYAHITNGYIDNADIKEANVENLTSKYAHITNGTIDNAKIGYADVDGLHAHYATVDIANVNNAWLQNGVVKNAAITNEQVQSVSANKLTAGTIDASEINVANLRAKNLIVEKMNGQPILGGYELVNKNSTGYSGKNPSNEGWYEYSNGTFTASTDTTVNMSKAYYKDGTQVALYDQAYIDGLENNLQQQIDGAIETFTGSAVPTLVNYPAVDWTSAQMANHVGDIYYVVNAGNQYDGYSYRFSYDNSTSTYSWRLIRDSGVTAALADISDLQTFQSNTESWITETDEGLETIRTNHTSLSGVVNKTVKSSTQLWFTKANTTAPSAPTSEVTSDSTSGNAWRRVVPTYNASYPYYFYCWQYKYVDNTFGWSAVIYDQATTESEERARTGVANAATADGKAVSAQNTANANIKSSVQLWFTKANTTAPSKPSSQVTNNSATGSNSYNKWNLVVPVYNSSYPYYYYCYQQQKGDGTYQWSDVVYDQATSEAMKKAQEALPASTFTTFESTTFKNVKDTVDEQSSTITNLSTRVDNIQVGGRNLLKATDVSLESQAQSGISGGYFIDDVSDGTVITISVQIDADNVTWDTTANKHRLGVEFNIQVTSGQYYQYIGVWAGEELSTGDNVVEAFTGSFHGRISKTFTLLGNVSKNVNAWLYIQGVQSGTVKVSRVKVEKGNMATDWSVAPEETSEQITTVSNTVNSVSQTATSNSSKISNLTTTLSTNADGTTKTGDIMHRMSATEQDLSGFKTTVSQTYTTKTEFENLDIGGRNLLSETDTLNIGTGVTYTNHTLTNNDWLDSKTYFHFYLWSVPSKGYANWVNMCDPVGITETGKYIKTFEAQNESQGYWLIKHNGILHDIGWIFKNYESISEGDVLTISFDVIGCNPSVENGLAIKNFKLERGNKATDYTPAPEDIETRVSLAESSITQTADSIISLVSNGETYTKPDGTTATNTIRSAIKQNADNIDLRVEKSGVIASINASTESSGGSAVKISADKVNIEGATIFTGNGRLSQTSLNNAYDAKGSASTAESNAKSYTDTATNDMATNTGVAGTYATKTNAVSEEQYIYISKASGTTSVSGTTTWVSVSSDSQNTWTTKRPTYNTSYPVLFIAKQKKTVSGTVTCTTPIKDDTTTVIDGGHITTGTIDANRLNITDIISNGNIIVKNDNISNLTNDSGFQNSTQVSTAISNAPFEKVFYVNANSTADEKDANKMLTTGVYHCACSITNAPETSYGTITVEANAGTKNQEYRPDNKTYFYRRYYNNSGGVWYDWVKADAATAQSTADAAAPKTSAISRSQRIYWRATSASGKPSANNTWLSTSGTGYDNWSLKIPKLTSGTTKYPFLYTAVQTQTVSQQAAGTTCSCSEVLLDDTTTVIDGGTIITNSVHANAVNSAYGAFDTALIPDLNASKITAGTISVSRIPDDALNSNVQVGGRNLIIGSDTSRTTTDSSYGVYGGKFPNLISEGTEITISVQIDADNIVWDTSASFNRLGVEFAISKTGGGYQYIGVWAGKTISGNTVEAFTGSLHKRISNTYTLLGDIPIDKEVTLYAQGVSSGTSIVSNVKIEVGNKATDWTPAPEDVQAEIDAKKSTHTLTASNTNGSSYATILGYAAEGHSEYWDVTSTAGVKVGDTVRIAYLANDMGANGTTVYVVGTVTSITTATQLVMTSHGLDTTVIDGGHILTGTIDANKVNIQNLTVGSAQSGWGNVLNSNVQVGGRNLLINSFPTQSSSNFNYTKRTITNLVSDSRSPGNIQVQYYTKAGSYVGTVMNTVDINGTGKGAIQFTCLANVDKDEHNLVIGHNGSQKDLKIKFAISENLISGKEYVLSFERLVDIDVTTVGGYVVKNHKLESGNRATDFTPAIEDIEKTQIIYRSTDEAFVNPPTSWVTYTGKNLVSIDLPPATVNGVTYTPANDYVIANGTVNGTGGYRLCPNFTIPEGTYYAWCGGATANGVRAVFYIGGRYYDVTTESKTTITIPSGGATGYVCLRGETSGTTVSNVLLKPMLYSSTEPSDEYEPYIGWNNIWTTKRPRYRKNFPNMFVAQQTLLYDGSVVCTTPQRDDTTTRIKYVTEIDENGIWVTPTGKTPTNASTGAGATGTKIDGTGVGIYNAGKQTAQYGSTTTFYKSDGTTPAATIGANGIDLKAGGTLGGWTINQSTLSRTQTQSSGIVDDVSLTADGVLLDRDYSNSSYASTNDHGYVQLSPNGFEATLQLQDVVTYQTSVTANLVNTPELQIKSHTPIVVETVTADNITINGNSLYTWDKTGLSKTGYTLAGVVGFGISNATTSGTNSSLCTAYYCRKNSASSIQMLIRNTGSASSASANSYGAAKVKLTADLLWISNGMI